MERKDLLMVAIKAAFLGGKEIMKVYASDSFETEMKEDKSPLTAADRNAHQAIVEVLKQTNIPILSEEGKQLPFEERKDWDLLWVVDPLDGTKEFIKRNGEFTVNIALVEKGNPIAGVLYVPAKRDLYLGSVETGSYKIERVDAQTEIPNWESLVKACDKLPLNEKPEEKVVASRSHLNEDTEKFIDRLKKQYPNVSLVSAGSALKICLVAEGEAMVYPRYAPTMEWDTAAGHAIALGAGCVLVNPETSQPLVYNKADLLNPYFIVMKSDATFEL